MKVIELREILSSLPDEMNVVISVGEEAFVTVCREQSGIMEMPVEDESAQDGYRFEEVAVLMPCTCTAEVPLVANPDQPLN